MSELSKAIAKMKIVGNHTFPDLRKHLKAAFREGWEAREYLLNKRVAEIEKAATLKERERCAIICDCYAENSHSTSNFSENCATAIRSGK